ncbi:MAG: response regulator transcription factor [Acidobacteria bacterium]|nr:response regulator transcription factor [Acidobacteriota bacterium]
MRILIADDDSGMRLSLEERLTSWGYRVVSCVDGEEALMTLLSPSAPSVGILDWTMPGYEGPEICPRVRQRSRSSKPYLILLTARNSRDDIVEGLISGADDYVAKPYDARELWARLQLALRVVNLQDRLTELEATRQAIAGPQTFGDLLPLCAHCKGIRNDQEDWQSLESFLGSRDGLQFTHSICPDCIAEVYEPTLNPVRSRG